MDFCCLLDMILPPNRLSSNPPISLGWVVTLSTSLVDMLLSLSRLASNPHTNLVWVVAFSTTMMSSWGFFGLWGIVLSPTRQPPYPPIYLAAWVVNISVFSCQTGLVTTPSRQFLITSPN